MAKTSDGGAAIEDVIRIDYGDDDDDEDEGNRANGYAYYT